MNGGGGEEQVLAVSIGDVAVTGRSGRRNGPAARKMVVKTKVVGLVSEGASEWTAAGGWQRWSEGEREERKRLLLWYSET